MTPLPLGPGPHGNEYSSVNAWSCDSTRMLVLGSALPNILDHFTVLDGDGKIIEELGIAASAEPRWSRTDPNRFYFIRGNALMGFVFGLAPQVAAIYIEHTFAEYASISGKGESDLSPSGWMVFAGLRPDRVEEVFVFDLNAGTKGPVFLQTVPIDGLKVTSTNQAIVSNQDGIWVCE
jgi:hypothetical protein